MKKKCKILICGVLPPPLFGHSAMYKILTESSFMQAYDVTFLNLHFWTYGQNRKVTILKLFKLVKYLCQYVYLLITVRPDYMLYNISFEKMPFLKDYLFCYIAKCFGVSFVLHDFGQYVRELYESLNVSSQKKLKWMLDHMSASIVMGENTRTKYAGLVSEDKLLVVPGSVEDSVDIQTDFIEKNESVVNVLYFSYLSQSKGVLVALQVAQELMEKNDNIIFTFAGPFESQDIEEQLQKLINIYPNRVVYKGYVQSDQKRTQLFREADIFFFPTLRDVFGLVLLHAMAESLPIVASVEGSIPEILPSECNGLLFPKGDVLAAQHALLKLVEDPALRRSMGEANRIRYCEVYAPKQFGQTMIEMFQTIQNGRICCQTK